MFNILFVFKFWFKCQVCINVVLLVLSEHSNNGQILHQNYNEEDGGTP